MNPEIKIGSLSMSQSSSDFINSLVFSEKDYDLDYRPFSSIVEGFRFSFALGFLKGVSKQREGKQSGIAPRFFISKDYYDLIQEEALESGKSIGQLISDYAEGGVSIMTEKGSSIIELIAELED